MTSYYPEIRFRAVEPQDAELFYQTENDDTSWGDSDTLAPFSRKILREYANNYMANPIQDEQLRLIAEDSDSGEVVGILDFYDINIMARRAFIAVYIRPHLRRQGYGRATLLKAEEFAQRRLGVLTLAAKILPANKASKRLFKSCGFNFQARLPKWHFCNGNIWDVDIYLYLVE